jgi:hypothetical protein
MSRETLKILKYFVRCIAAIRRRFLRTPTRLSSLTV